MILKKSSREEERIREEQQTVPSVSELTRDITDILESQFDRIAVQGEISTWTRAASGHTYFTLKDEHALLSAVLWRNRTLRYPIEEGMQVIATGRITVYGPRGQYQLDCATLVPLGRGELQLAFERLKVSLQEEGLFDQDRKRPLPLHPRRIGIVTSRTGAAVQDIITTLSRRMPSVNVILRPALVQGTTAAEDIAEGIRELNRAENIDLLIVGRGGGSIEDLWAFNEEVVARAIADSRIPVISAVGHETDITIADFVADMRAPTPTAAAELAVRDRTELLAILDESNHRLNAEIAEKILTLKTELRALLKSRGMNRPLDLLRIGQQRLDDLTHRSALGIHRHLRRSHEQLELLRANLRTLNPEGILKRGYAIVERDGKPVIRAETLHSNDTVSLRFHDGRRKATIAED